MIVRDFKPREKQIVEAARRYLGVPFRHQGRSRLGVDCLGLLVCIARDCDLKHDEKQIFLLDEVDYGHFPDPKRLYFGLMKVFEPVSREDMHVGDVLLLRIDGQARHLAVVGDYSLGGLSLIHAYAPARKVVEHRLDESWMEKVRTVLRLH